MDYKTYMEEHHAAFRKFLKEEEKRSYGTYTSYSSTIKCSFEGYKNTNYASAKNAFVRYLEWARKQSSLIHSESGLVGAIKRSMPRVYPNYEFIGEEIIIDADSRIDLLYKDKETGDYIFYEVKKGEVGDEVIGQAMRYKVGLMKQYKKNNVRGVVIGKEIKKTFKQAATLVKDWLSYAPFVEEVNWEEIHS